MIYWELLNVLGLESPLGAESPRFKFGRPDTFYQALFSGQAFS